MLDRDHRGQVFDDPRDHGQHPGVHRVDLGTSAEGGEAPDLEGVDRVEEESGLLEGILEVAVEGPEGSVLVTGEER